jgi:hypothetical protein
MAQPELNPEVAASSMTDKIKNCDRKLISIRMFVYTTPLTARQQWPVRADTPYEILPFLRLVIASLSDAPLNFSFK